MENMTGIELIAKERQEQIKKHKWEDTEKTWYLTSLAQYLLLVDDDAEKDNLGDYIFGIDGGVDPKWRAKFDSKGEIQRLVTAGALLAAEIDRIQKLEKNDPI